MGRPRGGCAAPDRAQNWSNVGDGWLWVHKQLLCDHPAVVAVLVDDELQGLTLGGPTSGGVITEEDHVDWEWLPEIEVPLRGRRVDAVRETEERRGFHGGEHRCGQFEGGIAVTHRRARHLTGMLLSGLLLAAVVATGWAGSAIAVPSKQGGNAENAKACHKGGWEDLARTDGTAFASEEQCVSYAAQGGTLQEKQEVFTSVGPTLLDLTSPDRAPYVQGTNYQVMPGSGSGDVTARLVSIDIALAPGALSTSNPQPADTSTSGCEQADYTAAGFQAGAVALIQRGTCSLDLKVALAIANGASAVLIFNEGQAPERTTSNFGSVDRVAVPVLSTSYAAGFEMYNLTQAGVVTIHVVTNTQYS